MAICTATNERIKMSAKKYPILLISLMLISYMSPLFDYKEEMVSDINSMETSSRSTACIGDVCISEILVNAVGNEYDSVGPADWTVGEWVEIYNSGSTTINLSTWTLSDKSSRSLSMTLDHVVYPNGATNLEVAPGGYIVLARNGAPATGCNFCLTNSNGLVDLTNPSGTLVHSVTWTSRPTEGVSLIEDSNDPTDNWVESATLSPGQSNQGGIPVGPVYFAGDLVINEVMADASPSFDNATWPGGEWVEIINQGNIDFDLTGWEISDAAGNILEFDEEHLIGYSSDIESMMINSGETRILAVNGTTNSGVLNNAVEKLRLHWPNGSISDEVNWTKSEPGFSLSRIHGSDNMFISAYPTPNATNLERMENLPIMSNDIILTEYLPSTNSTGAFPDGKWIEVLNNGSNVVDLQGWTITNGRADILYLDPGTVIFNQSHASTTEISAGERRVIQMSNNFDMYDYYEHLVLKDSSDNIVDVGWHSNYFGDNVSMIRDYSSLGSSWIPANWVTPGQPEPGNEPPSMKNVRFNEIMPDPEGNETQLWPNSEWVEVYNYESSPVNLDGWKLKAANSRSFTIDALDLPLQLDTIIQPNSVALIALNGSSFYLKGKADLITLVDESSAIVDTVGWNLSKENTSLIAPGNSHAGYTTTWPTGESGWVQSAWPTPGEVNPEWSAYTDSNELIVTEYMGLCSKSGKNYPDWIEIYNNGSSAINLSRWRLDSTTDRHFINHLADVDSTDGSNIIANATKSTVLAPGEFGLVSLPNSFVIAPPDLIDLFNPDGISVSESLSHGEGLTPASCQSWISDDGVSWSLAAYSTPGDENVGATDFAKAGDLIFTRISPYDNDFIQIKNIGEKDAYLMDWNIKINDGMIDQCSIDSSNFYAPQSNIIIGDVSDINQIDLDDYTFYDGITPVFLSFSDIGCSGMNIPDLGVSISISDIAGNNSDTFVFDSGPASNSLGWDGEAVSVPTTSISNDEFIYVRGDGCSNLPDTNTANDWKHQWSIGGVLTTLCLPTEITTAESIITPIIGPQNGLLELIQWIDDSETSIKIQLYQLQEENLVQALLDAIERGVNVELMLDPGCYGCNIWSPTDLQYKNDYSYLLIDAGATVYEFNTNSNEPYLYLHSKVAVRDSSSIWISSGNWKYSSVPEPGVRGNVEWSMIVDNDELATMVQQQFELDKIVSEQMSLGEYDEYEFFTPDSIGGGGLEPEIQTSVSGELVTCPSNCVTKIVNFIKSADNEVLLSQQTLDLDWSYGWGDENPIITALHDVAQNGVSVRLIINGAYLDDDDQEVVDLFNEVWNGSQGLDASAIVMGEDDDVAKLHNKGIIVDGESVLVSSINMGSSAMNRNREMGVIIHSPVVTQYYLDGWHEDWNRLDNVTDTDQDSLTDKWEVANGLNRTKRTLESGITEDKFDADGDGLNNTVEEKQGSHPLLADTDGDCAIDSVEILWAQNTALNSSITNVAIYDALNLADADGDGVKDTDKYGCDLSLGITITEPLSNQTSDPELDDDNDGIINKNDLCPNTEVGGLTDQDGCSSQQLIDLSDASDGEEDNTGSNTMLTIMIIAALLTVGAFLILKRLEASAIESKNLVSLAEQETMVDENSQPLQEQSWEMPVLDGTSNQGVEEKIDNDDKEQAEKDDNKDNAISSDDIAKFPGWSEEIIQRYLDNGWTIEQLSVYYQEQLSNNE